jgi:hypothetical protein
MRDFHPEKDRLRGVDVASSQLTSRSGHGINFGRHVDRWCVGNSQEPRRCVCLPTPWGSEEQPRCGDLMNGLDREIPGSEPPPFSSAPRFGVPPASTPAAGHPLVFSPPPPPPEGQEIVAAIAGLAPLLFSLYAIFTVGERISGRSLLIIGVGAVGLYGAILLGVGVLLCRHPARLPAGRTLVALAGTLASFVAATSWAASLSNLSLVTTAGSTVLGLCAAGFYARLCGRPTRSVLPLVVAILALGLSGRFSGLVPIVFKRAAGLVEIGASVLACGVFLRPDRRTEPVGAIAMALAVPLAALLTLVGWSGAVIIPHIVPLAIVTVVAIRSMRPYFHEGAATVLACALLGGGLWIAHGRFHARYLTLVIGLFAMLRTTAEVEGDSSVGAIDRRSPAWFAGALWLIIAITWANDLDLFEHLFALPRGWLPANHAWSGLFALPLALPAFLLSRVRRFGPLPQTDLGDPEPGTIPELSGWSILAAAAALATTAASREMWPNVALTTAAGAALIAALWVASANPLPWRRIGAHLLLLVAFWLLAQRRQDGVLVLAASLAAFALALWTLVRPSRWEAGVVGLVAFPLLVTEAVVRGAPAPLVAGLLGLYGVLQLLRPPLANAPWTRMAGPFALVAAAWVLLDRTVQPTQVAGLAAILKINPLSAIAMGSAAPALALFLMADHLRRKAAVALMNEGPDVRPVELDPPDPGVALEALGWSFLGLGATITLLPATTTTWAGVAAVAADWIVAVIGARLAPTAIRRLGSHVLLIAGLWALGVHLGSPAATLAASVGACSLALAPLSRRFSRESGLAGLALFPFAIGDSLARGALQGPAAVLLLVYGLVYAVRPPLKDFPWSRVVGPPAVLVATWLVLHGKVFTLPLWSSVGLTTVAALVLTPFALWTALAGGPLVFVLEVLLGAVAGLLMDCAPIALLPLAVLALGRNEVGFSAGAAVLLLGAAGVVAYGPAGGAYMSAGAFALAGAVLLWRPLPLDVQRLRTVGPLGLFVAPLIVFFSPGRGAAFFAIEHLPLAAALCALPFALGIRRRGGPSFLVWQTILGSALVAALAIAAAHVWPPRSLIAMEAVAAALLAMAAAVVASRPAGPEVSTMVWAFAALAAPVALIPMSTDPWHWPVAIVAGLEVFALGIAARRRSSPPLAASALWLGLLVSAWMGLAVSHRALHDAVIPMAAIAALATAATGFLVLWRGRIWLGAPQFFLQPFVNTCLALASMLAVSTLVLGAHRESDVFPSLLALGGASVLAVRMAWQSRTGWPLFVAAGGLVVAYAGLRLRTDIADFLQHWDGLAFVAAGLMLAVFEKRLRTTAGALAPDLAAIAPDELHFAVPALRMTTAFLVSLSALAFVDQRGAFDVLAPLIAVVFFYFRARLDAPLYAVLAVVLFGASVVAVLSGARVVSAAAYTVPLGVSAALFLRRYRDHLGHEEGAVRAVPPLAMVVACAYDVFTTTGLRPDLVLAGLGALLFLTSRRWGLLADLLLGSCSALLAIVDVVLDQRLSGAGESIQVIWLAPLVSLVASGAGLLVLRVSARLFVDPAEFRPPVVRGLLGLAAVGAGFTLALAPADRLFDVALAMFVLVGVAGLAFALARFERLGWPLLVTGAAPVLAYAYWRARTSRMDDLHRWDALVAVGAGVILIGIERLRWRATGATNDIAFTPPEDVPFGVAEIRLGTAIVMVLAGVAFFDLHGPIDALGPGVAALFFFSRARREAPLYGVLGALFSYTILVLFMVERNVSNPIAYAVPLGTVAAVLMHVYREALGYEGAALRVIPPVATGAVCLFDAAKSQSIIVSASTLVALGLTLAALSRLWQVRSHLFVGLGCLAAAMLILISDWNARGWTVAAIALGAGSMLIPALLLRWR